MDAIRGRSANGVHFPAYASDLGDDEGDVGELVDGLRAGLYHDEKRAWSGRVRLGDKTRADNAYPHQGQMGDAQADLALGEG